MFENILPVIVGVVVNFIIGMLWYSPVLFGKLWMEAKGLKKDEMKPDPKDFILAVINAVVLVVVLNIFISMPRVVSIGHAVFVSFLVWIGFAVTTQVQELTWGGKPLKVFLLDISHQFANYTVVGIVLFLL